MKWIASLLIGIGIALSLLSAPVLFGGAPTASTLSTATDVATAEDNYFTGHGSYVQVLPLAKLPAYETGTVKTLLGKTTADNVRVDVYAQPDGQQGYQVVLQNADGSVSSQGFGPQAQDRTYSIPAPDAMTASVASSTL